MRIVFRTDGSVKIGTGHVARCLTLAHALKADGADCHFIMRSHEGNMIHEVRDQGFAVFELAMEDLHLDPNEEWLAHANWLGASWQNDAVACRSILSELGLVDWIITDHYALDARWEKALRYQSKRIMVIDDLADRAHDCDILLDQNLRHDVDCYALLVPPTCQCLIGPKFSLLRPEFGARREGLQRDTAKPVERILVFMGGVDFPGATLPILNAIDGAIPNDIHIDVVVGRNNQNSKAIEDWCCSRPFSQFYFGSADMPHLMTIADLAVGAGGVTTWERCCLSLPSLIVAIADNQHSGATAVADFGGALYAGDANRLDLDAVRAALKTLVCNPQLRQHLARQSGQLVDGNGVKRVTSAIRRFGLSLRRARRTDCKRVWKWRNAEETRRYFFDPSPVSYISHQAWFNDSLNRTNRDLLVGEYGGKPVGVLRYDVDGDRAVVSVYLDPRAQGQGLGAGLLRAGSNWLRENRPSVDKVDAHVMAANKASRHAFSLADYTAYAMVMQANLSVNSTEREKTPL
jgi:UDP-2,4-diacetamido-2,4,6-trideoxy-beta-L-altropyranose hydrolase